MILVWHSLFLSAHFGVWVTVWVNESPQKLTYLKSCENRRNPDRTKQFKQDFRAATQIWTGNLILANPTKKLFQGVSACFWLFSLSFNYALGLFARSASSVPSVSVACYVVKCQRFRSLEILRSRRKCVEWARAFDSLCPYPFPSLCL